MCMCMCVRGGGVSLDCEAPECACLQLGSPPYLPSVCCRHRHQGTVALSQFRSRCVWGAGVRQGTGVEMVRLLTPVSLSLIYLLWLLHHLGPHPNGGCQVLSWLRWGQLHRRILATLCQSQGNAVKVKFKPKPKPCPQANVPYRSYALDLPLACACWGCRTAAASGYPAT